MDNKGLLCISAGKVLAEERRVVIRRDTVGDLDPGEGAAVWPIERRASDWELQSLLPRRRSRAVANPANKLPERDLWSDEGVLEPWGHKSASVLWDPHVSSA